MNNKTNQHKSANSKRVFKEWALLTHKYRFLVKYTETTIFRSILLQPTYTTEHLRPIFLSLSQDLKTKHYYTHQQIAQFIVKALLSTWNKW